MFNMSGSGVIKTSSIGTAPDTWKYLGIALNSDVLDQTVDICTSGFVVAKRSSTYNMPSVLMNATTTHTTHVLTESVRFRDVGNDSDYTNDNDYNIIFDVGLGNTIELDVTSFEFEASTCMCDRLGIQVGGNGTDPTWVTGNVPWLKSSTVTDPFWGINVACHIDGYIFPALSTDTDSGVPPLPATIVLDQRWVRFYFWSDGSVAKPGWDINVVVPEIPTGVSNSIVLETPLYLDTGNFSNVTETTGGQLIGYVAGTATDNNNVFLRAI
jgi:hypothetical protein